MPKPKLPKLTSDDLQDTRSSTELEHALSQLTARYATQKQKLLTEQYAERNAASRELADRQRLARQKLDDECKAYTGLLKAKVKNAQNREALAEFTARTDRETKGRRESELSKLRAKEAEQAAKQAALEAEREEARKLRD